MSDTKTLARHYQSQQILNASPAEQVVMLYDGAITHCGRAKEAILAGDIQARHNNNRRVMEIVGYLLDILDTEKGGDVAKRLKAIYSFLLRRLLDVDFRNDPRICDEVMDHLKTLRGSWQKIAQSEKAGGAAKQGPQAEAPELPRITAAVA
jgi:flagellar protein FliS